MKKRPDGYVKHLVSVCIDAGMTMDEVHFGTRIPKSHLRSVAYAMGSRFRSPYKPLIKYHASPNK
jgi:hypothetical protein